MRTLDLIRALEHNERREVDLLVNNSRRKGVQVLYREICRHAEKNTLPDNEFLYRKAFGKKYTRDKDYLLRNELRLLNNLIYEYMVTTFVGQELKHNAGLFNFWLALCFHKRNLKDLFKAEIDGLIDSLENSPNSYATVHPSYAAALHAMKSIFMITHQPRLIENLDAQLQMIDKWRAQEEKQFLYRMRELEARMAFIRYILHHLQRTYPELPDNFITPPQTVFDFSGFEKGDWFNRYMQLKKETFQTKNEVRLALQKEKLALETEKAGILGVYHAGVTMGAIGIELINVQRFAEADDYMEQSLAHCKKNKLPYNSADIQNYIANQINLGRYEKGIKIFEQYSADIENARGRNTIMIYVAFLYLLLYREDAAIKCLPEFAVLSPKEQVDCRFIYLVSFIIRREYKLALNDLNNLKRMIQKNFGNDFTERLEIVSLFNNYIKACTLKGAENKKALAALKTVVKKNKVHLNKLASLYFELRWLMDAVKGE